MTFFTHFKLVEREGVYPATVVGHRGLVMALSFLTMKSNASDSQTDRDVMRALSETMRVINMSFVFKEHISTTQVETLATQISSLPKHISTVVENFLKIC
jgi:hypothetical protein